MAYETTALEDALWAYFDDLLGGVPEKVIFAAQQGTRPTPATFFTLYVTGDDALGRPDVTRFTRDDLDVGTIIERSDQLREGLLLLSAYGPGAYGELRDVDNLLLTPYHTEQAAIQRLSIESDGTITRLSVTLGPEQENRASKSYRVRYIDRTEVEIPALGEVVGTLEVSDSTSTLTQADAVSVDFDETP